MFLNCCRTNNVHHPNDINKKKFKFLSVIKINFLNKRSKIKNKTYFSTW